MGIELSGLAGKACLHGADYGVSHLVLPPAVAITIGRATRKIKQLD
jgi:hypothetical protein